MMYPLKPTMGLNSLKKTGFSVIQVGDPPL